MKTTLRIQTGRYTLSTTVSLPVPMGEMEAIMAEARKLGGESAVIKRKYAKRKYKRIISRYKTGSNQRRWTKDELRQIKELYPTHSVTKISKIINRTPNAIFYKLRECGIKKPGRKGLDANAGLSEKKEYRREGMWTPQEIKILKTKSKNLTSRDLSRFVGRTLAATKKKLYQLGIKTRGKSGRPAKGPQKIWTKKEEAFVLRNARKLSWDEIGKQCGVSAKKVYDKWYYLAKRT